MKLSVSLDWYKSYLMCAKCEEAKKKLALEQDEFIADIVLTGDYFGYPRCCSYEFAFIIMSGTLSRAPIQEDYDVHQGWGFIPCVKHATQIKEGKITLQSLITDRHCPRKFPNAGSNKIMQKWLNEKMGSTNYKELVTNLINSNFAK